MYTLFLLLSLTFVKYSLIVIINTECEAGRRILFNAGEVMRQLRKLMASRPVAYPGMRTGRGQCVIDKLQFIIYALVRARYILCAFIFH